MRYCFLLYRMSQDNTKSFIISYLFLQSNLIVMSFSSYVQTNPNTYSPINITPTNTIKCRNCHVMVPVDQIEIHSKNHTKHQYLQYYFQGLGHQSTPTINLLNFLPKQDEDDEMIKPISVESIPEEQLPSIDNGNRPQGFVLSAKLQQREKPSGFSTFLSEFVSLDKKEENLSEEKLTNQLDMQEAKPQSEDELQILKEVPLNAKNLKIQKKKINRYSNIKSGPQSYKDTQSAIKRQPINLATPYVDIENYAIISDKNSQPQQENIETFMMNTQPKQRQSHKLKINTLSTSGGFFSRLRRKRHEFLYSDYSNNLVQKSDNHNSKFECEGCKGFHCKQCGSTIPPIHRPVPDRNGRYLRSPQADRFYNKYFKGQSKSECTDCDYQ